MGPSRRAATGPSRQRIKDPARRPVRLRPSAPCQATYTLEGGRPGNLTTAAATRRNCTHETRCARNSGCSTHPRGPAAYEQQLRNLNLPIGTGNVHTIAVTAHLPAGHYLVNAALDIANIPPAQSYSAGSEFHRTSQAMPSLTTTARSTTRAAHPSAATVSPSALSPSRPLPATVSLPGQPFTAAPAAPLSATSP
jgi:hypothetical protein